MTVKELYETGIRLLSGGESPKTDARAILEYLLGIDFGKLPLYYEQSADAISEEFFCAIKKRKNDMPLSYITGKKEFFSRNFQITEGVLVPRPETENLVEAVLEATTDDNALIADVCSGSGCIGITLALERGFGVDLYELSPSAAAVSRNNIDALGATGVCVYEADILKELLKKQYDVIVSNPPYIPAADMDLLMPDVLKYEPKMALTDGGDGLLFYRRLCELAKSHLKEGGLLAAEVGINQHMPVAELFGELGKPEIFRDYFGVERVVMVRKGVF